MKQIHIYNIDTNVKTQMKKKTVVKHMEIGHRERMEQICKVQNGNENTCKNNYNILITLVIISIIIQDTANPKC